MEKNTEEHKKIRLKLAQARYYQKHKEKKLAAQAEREKRNPEKYREMRRRAAEVYRKKHPQRVADSLKKYRKKNKQKEYLRFCEYRDKYPEKFKVYDNNKRAKRKLALGNFTKTEWDELKNRYGNKCLACGQTDVKLTIDHVVPLSRGGTNNIDNIQPLCFSCNSKKWAKIIDYRSLEIKNMV